MKAVVDKFLLTRIDAHNHAKFLQRAHSLFTGKPYPYNDAYDSSLELLYPDLLSSEGRSNGDSACPANQREIHTTR